VDGGLGCVSTVEVAMGPAEVLVRPLWHDEAVRLKRLSKRGQASVRAPARGGVAGIQREDDGDEAGRSGRLGAPGEVLGLCCVGESKRNGLPTGPTPASARVELAARSAHKSTLTNREGQHRGPRVTDRTRFAAEVSRRSPRTTPMLLSVQGGWSLAKRLPGKGEAPAPSGKDAGVSRSSAMADLARRRLTATCDRHNGSNVESSPPGARAHARTASPRTGRGRGGPSLES